MKTLKGWEESNLDMDEYLNEPCEIDEQLYLEILDCVPPHYLGDLAQQGERKENPINGCFIMWECTL